MDVVFIFYIDRLTYRKKAEMLPTTSRAPSFSKHRSLRNAPSRTVSLNNPMIELKPLEVLCK